MSVEIVPVEIMPVERKGSPVAKARAFEGENGVAQPASTATARVQRLRERLLNTTPEVCAERARYLTEAYRQHEADPPVLRRAKALAHVLDKMTIYVDEGELLVGNQASRPRAAPIFPEYSSDWIEQEIDEFARRRADVYLVRPEVKEELLKEILPYWRGRTLYDRVMVVLPEHVKEAQEMGVISGRGNITSGDGHIIVDYPKLMSIGLEGIIAKAEQVLDALSPYDATEARKRPFLEAVGIACRAAIRFAARYAEKAEVQAVQERDPGRRAELENVATICRRVPAKPPRTFHEALQSAWFVQLILQIESNGHSFSMGRLDQYTYPFCRADIDAGRLTEEQAIELLECLWLKLFSVIKIRPWSHTRFGIGYPTYQNVTIGGLDRSGQDATNDLSYMILRTMRETRLTQPNVSARYHSGSPEGFLVECGRTIRMGFGMPAMKNDEIIIPALLEKGVCPEDAYDYAIVGCVEAAVPGKWGYRNTGMAFLNMLKALELAYNNGRDPNTGVVLCPGSGSLADLRSFDELYDAFLQQLHYYTRCHVEMDTCADLALEEMVPDAFCSALVLDCVARGKTIKEGGAVYDVVSGLQSGLANVANSLMAIKNRVYKEGALTLEELGHALETNFAGQGGERIRQLLLSAPKYGNDIDEVDHLAARILIDYLHEAAKYHTSRYGRGPIGGTYAGSTSNISANVPLGQPVCATPDGRKAGQPIAEGVSPTHHTMEKGPTAIMCSVAKLPTIKMIAQLLNLRLAPGSLDTEEGLRQLARLLRGFQAVKGWHVQFNTASTETLLDAQQHPDKYRDLVVRVAGYSALFVTLDKATQDDIIERTTHSI
jgi:pyruvate formate-lyase/glycerol dehydratase family glycyl radical enzyme